MKTPRRVKQTSLEKTNTVISLTHWACNREAQRQGHWTRSVVVGGGGIRVSAHGILRGRSGAWWMDGGGILCRQATLRLCVLCLSFHHNDIHVQGSWDAPASELPGLLQSLCFPSALCCLCLPESCRAFLAGGHCENGGLGALKWAAPAASLMRLEAVPGAPGNRSFFESSPMLGSNPPMLPMSIQP